MKRLLTYATLTFLFTFVLFSGSGFAAEQELDQGANAPVTLNENIIVSDTYIRLKDLFSNVPMDKAQTAVAYSPKPGRRASFDARWLYRVAHAYGLQWRPLSADLRTLVTRDSIVIQKDEIKDALMASLLNYDIPQNPQVELSNHNLRIHVSSEMMPEVRVEDMNYNRRTHRFAAIIGIGEKDMNAIQRIRVTGQVHEMLEVPTLSRRVNKGEVIEEKDVTWLKLRADRTQRDVIMDVSQIIGMTPKRSLRPEQPLRNIDVQTPVMVPKGSIVTIILKKPGMTLTSQGRAMENGSDGETIRVANTKTSRTIDAIVVGSSMVTVLGNTSKADQLAFNQ